MNGQVLTPKPSGALKSREKPQTSGRIQVQTPEKWQTQWALAGPEKKDQELLVAMSHRTPRLNGETERFKILSIQPWKLIDKNLCSW